MLVALATAPTIVATIGNAGSLAAMLFYLVAYGCMTVGVFVVVSMLDQPQRPVETVEDFAGLSRTHPGLVLTGDSPVQSDWHSAHGRFYGKILGLLQHPFRARSPDWLYIVLAVVGMINAAIGGWYYLRLVATMYLRDPVRSD